MNFLCIHLVSEWEKSARDTIPGPTAVLCDSIQRVQDVKDILCGVNVNIMRITSACWALWVFAWGGEISFPEWWEEDTKTQGIVGLAWGDKGIGMLVWLRSPQIRRLQLRSGRHSQIVEGTRRRNTDRTRQGHNLWRTERTRAHTV